MRNDRGEPPTRAGVRELYAIGGAGASRPPFGRADPAGA